MQNTINKDQAIKELEALKKQMAVLEKVINTPQKITDLIHSFEDVVEHLNEKYQDRIQAINQIPDLFEHLRNQAKAEIVIEVLNEGWEADWDDSNQPKYYIWWKMSSSGVGFSYAYCGDQNAHSCVGSVLCLKSKELCQHIGNSPKLVQLFKSFMLHKNKNQ